MKPRKKAKLLDTRAIKTKLDELSIQLVLLNKQSRDMNDAQEPQDDIDEIYLQMADVYIAMRDCVDIQLRQENPSLVSLFDALVHFKQEMH